MTTCYARVYAAAGAVMRGTGVVMDSPLANEKQTVYVTTHGFFSSTTRAKQEDTWGAILMMLLGIVMFTVAVALFLVGLAIQVVEWPTRKIVSSRRLSELPASRYR